MPMKYKDTISIAGALLTLTLFTGSVMAQAPAQPPAPIPAPGAPPQQAQPQPRAQAAQDQTARGELTSVDATAKTLTIKPTEGAEQKFTYTETTKVTGGREGVAGLATMSGRQVTVHFTMQGANRVASEIELMPEKN